MRRIACQQRAYPAGHSLAGFLQCKQAYCVSEVRQGEEAGEVAMKLRELADQVDELNE